MSFESDDISDLSDETEELNKLFDRVGANIKQKRVTGSTPSKKKASFKNVSSANNSQQTARSSLRNINTQARTTSSKLRDHTNTNANANANINTNTVNNNSTKSTLLTFNKFASFCESSFGVSSFDDDDEEIFNFIAKKYGSPMKGANNAPPAAKLGNDVQSNPNTPSKGDRVQYDVYNESTPKLPPSSFKLNGTPKYTSTPITKTISLQQRLRNAMVSPLLREEDFARSSKFESDSDDEDDKGDEDEHEITEDDADKEDDHESYFRRKRLKQQKADASYIKWENKRQNFMSNQLASNMKSSPSTLHNIDNDKQLNDTNKNTASNNNNNKPSTHHAAPSNHPPVFKGCTIYVNGYTVPSINEIHKMVILHGGKFTHMLSNKSMATHIVASRLTPKKHIEFKNCQVVKPQWVVDSVNEGVLKDWKPYSIINRREYGQGELQFANRREKRVESNNGARIENKQFAEPTPMPILEPERDEVNSNQEEDVLEDPLLPLQENEEEEQEKNLDFVPELQQLARQQASSSRAPLDSTHPNFLKYFFENSRLHHLSNWRSSFKSEFLTKSIERFDSRNKPNNPSRSKSNNNNDSATSMLFYMDFDCFFVRVSSMNYPNLDFDTLPMCVTHGTLTSDISSCNYVARRFGVRNGMWVRDAKKLCKNLICLKYDFKRYEKVSRQFYNYLLNSQDINCILPISVDECIVEFAKKNDKFSFNSQISDVQDDKEFFLSKAKNIKADIKSLTNCDVSIGISNNRILSRLSLKYAKPNGIYYIDSHSTDVKPFLEKHSFNDLPGIGRNLAVKLANTYFPHIKNVDNLLISDLYDSNITQEKLSKLFGSKLGAKYNNYINGKDDVEASNLIELLRSEYENHVLKKESISIDVNWGIRFETQKQVEKFLYDLAGELVKRMKHYHKIGSFLTLKIMKRIPKTQTAKFLGMGHCELVSKSSRLGLPTNDFGILLTEMRSLLRVASVEISEMRGVGVKISKLEDENKLNNQQRLNFGKKDGNLSNKFDKHQLKKPLKKPQINGLNKPEEIELSFELPSGFTLGEFKGLPKEIQDEIRMQRKSEILIKRFVEKNNLNYSRKVQQQQSKKAMAKSGVKKDLEQLAAALPLAEEAKRIISVKSTAAEESFDATNGSSLIGTQELFFLNNPNINKETYHELPSTLRVELVENWKHEAFQFKDKNEIDYKLNIKALRQRYRQAKKGAVRLDANDFLSHYCFGVTPTVALDDVCDWRKFRYGIDQFNSNDKWIVPSQRTRSRHSLTSISSQPQQASFMLLSMLSMQRRRKAIRGQSSHYEGFKNLLINANSLANVKDINKFLSYWIETNKKGPSKNDFDGFCQYVKKLMRKHQYGKISLILQKMKISIDKMETAIAQEAANKRRQILRRSGLKKRSFAETENSDISFCEDVSAVDNKRTKVKGTLDNDDNNNNNNNNNNNGDSDNSDDDDICFVGFSDKKHLQVQVPPKPKKSRVSFVDGYGSECDDGNSSVTLKTTQNDMLENSWQEAFRKLREMVQLEDSEVIIVV